MCTFELKNYPFDKQRCPINIGVPFDQESQVRIKLGAPPKKNELHFLQYEGVDFVEKAGQSSNETIETELNLIRYVWYIVIEAQKLRV